MHVFPDATDHIPTNTLFERFVFAILDATIKCLMMLIPERI